MPKELHSLEQFQKLLPRAVELRVFRENDSVKLKLRTPECLYTFRTNEDEAKDLVENAKDLEVREINPEKEKKKEAKETEESQ